MTTTPRRRPSRSRPPRRAGLRRAAGTALAWALGAGALAAGGCNYVAPAYLLIHGPPRVEKVYTLDPERPTVLFIDDPGNKLPRRQLRVVMAQEAEGLLLAKKVVRADDKVNHLISAQAAIAVADQEQFGERATIAQIGRDVGAEVVVWVAVDAFALSPDGQTLAPFAQVRTRVVDAASEQVLWPPEREGFPMTVNMPPGSGAAPSSRAEARELELALAQYAGRAIAEQFYTEEKPSSARSGQR